jgi:ubiquinol-cytochrome c reductase cytochrome c subunit
MLAALGLTTAVYAAIDSNKVQAAITSDAQIAAGKALFAEGCASCHGLNAEGTTDGPSLIGAGAAAVDFQVSSGRMPMATQSVQAPRKAAVYDEAQIAALAAYVASLAPGPAIPTDEMVDYSDADVALGGELWRANCAQCHNFAGQGGALTQGKYAPEVHQATARQIYEAMITGPQNMPVFADETLSVEQKQAVIAYVMEMRNADNPGGLDLGKFGPVTEGLFAWTGGMGLLIAAAIWIGVKAK